MLKTIFSTFVLLFSFEQVAAQITVSGIMTGSDGQPLPLANVSLCKPNVEQTVECVEAGRTGEFEITLPSKGVWLLRFSGVNHQEYTVAVYADRQKTITLNVRLAALRFPKDISGVKALGNFNRWYPPTAIPMRKQQDGTFTAEVKTSVNPVIYQLSGLTTGNFAGTMADRFTYDETHGYSSVLKTRGGKVRIIFDPGLLAKSDRRATFTFSESDSAESGFANVYDQVQRWNEEYTAALKEQIRAQRSGRKASGFDYVGVLSAIEKELKNERNEFVRQELHLAYFMFALKGGMADSVSARNLLREIPPSSIVWLLAPAAISRALDYSMYDELRQDQYVERVIGENPSAETISFLLSNEFMKMLYGGRKELALRYYDIAVNQFGETPGGREVANYHYVSAIDTGKDAPKFSARSMLDPDTSHTEKSFEGKYLLMDFWTTQSEPAVEEIKNLRRAYREFGGKHFVILTLSLDSSRHLVEEFERKHGKIAWPNAFIGDGFSSKICRDFEVYAVPKPILINPRGKVVAVGPDLRGEKLIKTLAKFLGKRK